MEKEEVSGETDMDETNKDSLVPEPSNDTPTHSKAVDVETAKSAVGKQLPMDAEISEDAPKTVDTVCTNLIAALTEKLKPASQDEKADQSKDLNCSTDSDMSGITPHELVFKEIPKGTILASGNPVESSGTSPGSNKENESLNLNPSIEPEPGIEMKKRATTLQVL